MPFICQVDRQTDYNLIPSSRPIVIDNGDSYFRIGWAGENDPRVIFRNIVQRPHHKHTGETVSVVGDHNTELLKYFDCSRAGPRSAFDSNVVYQFEIMEYAVLNDVSSEDSKTSFKLVRCNLTLFYDYWPSDECIEDGRRTITMDDMCQTREEWARYVNENCCQVPLG